MKKETIIKLVAERRNITAVEAGRTVDAFLEIIAETLEKHEPIILQNYFSFTPKPRKERTARNLSTGEPMTLAAHHTATCRFAARLRKLPELA